MAKKPRWVASIYYRHDVGEPEERLFTFEELEELHDIVEAGPDFYSIVNIVVMPSDRCPPTTLEKAALA